MWSSRKWWWRKLSQPLEIYLINEEMFNLQTQRMSNMRKFTCSHFHFALAHVTWMAWCYLQTFCSMSIVLFWLLFANNSIYEWLQNDFWMISFFHCLSTLTWHERALYIFAFSSFNLHKYNFIPVTIKPVWLFTSSRGIYCYFLYHRIAYNSLLM